MKRKALRYSLLILLYLLLALLFTWPLATQLTTHGFGVDEDSPYHIWHNWWFKFSIFKLHQNPLFTDYIFHPQKIPLVFDSNAFVFSALTLPLQLLTSVLTASNIVFIFSFVLSGLGAYFLTKYVLCSCDLYGRRRDRRGQAPQLQIELASFFAGVIYAFSPYTIAQAIDGHINLTSTWFLPFYAYFFLKSLNQPRKWKYAIGAGIFASLQALNDLTYTAFTIIFTGLAAGFFLVQTTLGHSGLTGYSPVPVLSRIRFWSRHSAPPQNDESLIRQFTNSLIHLLPSLTIIAAISFLIFLPVLIPTVQVYRLGLKPDAPLWVQNVWSADLVAFFRPNDHSTFLKSISYTPPRGTVEGTVFVSYTILALVLISITSWIRKVMGSEVRGQRSDKTRHAELDSASWGSGIWIFLAIAFFFFSLGPFLKIGDSWKWNIFGRQLPIPLPFVLLHKIPLIGGTQEPARMNPFLLLPLAILAANGMCILLDYIDTYRLKRGVLKLTNSLILLLTFFLIIFEFLQLPFPTTNLEPPPIYAEIAKDPEYFSVLALPVGFNSGQIALGKSPIGSLQYYQVIHQKPSFRGTVARLPAWVFDYYRDLPLFRIFIDPNRPPEPEDLDKETAQKLFKDQLHIKYIVIHKDKIENDLEKTKSLVEEVLEAKQIEESERTVSYLLK